MYRLIAQDEEHSRLLSIGGFTTEDGARDWWTSHYGDGGPWKLIGTSFQMSCGRAEAEWQEAGRDFVVRAQRVTDAPPQRWPTAPDPPTALGN